MGKPELLDEVVLHASEPSDETVAVSKTPDWFKSAWELGLIKPVDGDSIDGSDWVYLWVHTVQGDKICKTDDTIWIDKKGLLHVDTALHNRD